MTLSDYKPKNSIIYLISFYGAIIGQMMVYFALPYKNTSAVGMGVVIMALTCALGFLYLLFFEKKNFQDGILLILFVVWSFLFVFVIAGVSYANLIKVITFVEMPIYLSLSSRLKGKNIKQVIYSVALIYSIWFIFLSFQDFADVVETEYGLRHMNYLTLGYYNANETAMYLYGVFVLVVSALCYFKNKILKAIYAVVVIWMLYIIFQTSCRGIMVVSTLILLAAIFKNIRVNRTAICVILFVPIIFFLVTIAFNEQLVNAVFYGENFETGRYHLYSDYLDSLTFETFIFGNFKKYEFSNIHNAYLAVVSSLGMICFVMYFALLIKRFFDYANIRFGRSHAVLLWGLLGIIIYSSLEAAILVNGSSYAVITFLIKTALDSDKE